MKPLDQELTFSSASEDRLAELVRSAQPYQANPFRKRLIRARMQAGTRRSPRLVLRYAPVAVLLVCTSGAAAALGYRWMSDEAPAPGTTPPPAAPAPLLPLQTEPAAPTPPRSTTEDRPAVTAAPERAPSAKLKPSADRDKPKVAGEDPTQMLEAVRALRKEGNPSHAQTLLDGYLASNPSGALSEDALALSIEAAAARRDPRAKEYAQRYLTQFPNGRFRQLALRAASAER
jgi:hypothetical protein